MDPTELPAQLAADLDGAFPALLAAYQDLLFRVALGVVHDTRDAEEVAQDAFLRAYRALASYDRGRVAELRARPWLVQIALNVARNRVRRRAPREVPLDEVPAASEPRAPEGAGRLELAEQAAEWSRRLATLPEAQRTAVVLRHVEAMSYAEVAEAMGRPVGTVKADVHRGIRRLRAALLAAAARDDVEVSVR